MSTEAESRNGESEEYRRALGLDDLSKSLAWRSALSFILGMSVFVFGRLSDGWISETFFNLFGAFFVLLSLACIVGSLWARSARDRHLNKMSQRRKDRGSAGADRPLARMERDAVRASSTSDPELLGEMLSSPWEQVKAAVVLNPATPAKFVQALDHRNAGSRLLAALVLAPSVASADRKAIYARMGESDTGHSYDSKAELFWEMLNLYMAEIGRESQSDSVLRALSRSTSHSVMSAVAWNRYSTPAVRRHLRHWSVPQGIRFGASIPCRRRPSQETPWTTELAGAVTAGVQALSKRRSRRWAALGEW